MWGGQSLQRRDAPTKEKQMLITTDFCMAPYGYIEDINWCPFILALPSGEVKQQAILVASLASAWLCILPNISCSLGEITWVPRRCFLSLL